MRLAEQYKPYRRRQIGNRQQAAAASSIDCTAYGRAKHGREQQCARKNAKYGRSRYVGALRDWISEDCRCQRPHIVTPGSERRQQLRRDAVQSGVCSRR
jgi:hypothetical protein